MLSGSHCWDYLLSWYPFIDFKSLQLIWRLGTRRWIQQIPGLQWVAMTWLNECLHQVLSTTGRTQVYHRGVHHYSDVMMDMMASQITSLVIVYSTVYSDADQRKHQRFASLAFVRWIHRGPVNSPHKWPVTRKMFPFDYVIMHRTWCRWGFQSQQRNG